MFGPVGLSELAHIAVVHFRDFDLFLRRPEILDFVPHIACLFALCFFFLSGCF